MTVSKNDAHADNLPVMQPAFRNPCIPILVTQKKIVGNFSGDCFHLLPFSDQQHSHSTLRPSTFHFDFVASCFHRDV